MDVLVGVRVVRGPDWTWGEQDGGEGHVGTVAEVLKAADGAPGEVGGRGPCVVTVQWDCGNRCRYRCGVGDRYDLRVLDSAPAGIKHYRVMCNVCGLQLTGIRWKCVKCFDYDLCTFCYMSGKHELDHQFERMDTERVKVRVPTRVSSKKKEARGIYQHAEVMPGHDWATQTSLPTDEMDVMFLYGEVINIIGSNGDNSRGFAEVKWSETQHTSVHKVGAEGKVELKCVEPSCVSYYYPDHLPELGAPVDDDAVVQSHDISPGDYVKVELDPEIFKAMHEGIEDAGWDDLMMEVVGATGTVMRVFDSGNLRVKFSHIHVWTISAEAVVKEDVPRFSVGDRVCLTTDEHILRDLFTKHKDLSEYCSMFYGETCRVYDTYSKGNVMIVAKQKMWTFPPTLFVLQDDLASLPWSNPLPSADNLQALRDYLTRNPNQVNRKLSGRTALHCAAVTGNTTLIKILLDFGANIETEDSKRYRALHYAVMSGSVESAGVLIKAGAGVNTKGYNGNTPLLLAADRGHTGIAKLLLNHPTIKVHEVDVDGNTALHIAVFTQHLQIITLLLDAGADPSMVNFGLFNPFIEAARNGLTAAIEQMVDHNPENAKITNDFRYNLLHTGALYGNKDIVSLAVEKCHIDLESREDNGQTALHLAILESHIPVIEQLIKYGADVNAKNQKGFTPLHMVIMYRDLFDIPSDASPEINKFHKALMGTLPDNVSKLYTPTTLLMYLLKKGADMHIQNEAGQSPLATLPYLAKLMTTFVENEDLLSDDSTFTSQEGIFAMSGGDRPFMVSTVADPEFKSQHGREMSELVGSKGSYGKPYPLFNGRQIMSIDRAVFAYHPATGEQERGTSTTGYYSESSPGDFRPTAYEHDRSYSYGLNSSSQQQQTRQSMPNFSQRSPSEASTTKKMPTCFLCDSPANVRFQPCGHSVMCSQCAARAKKCPTCRGPVKSSTRI